MKRDSLTPSLFDEPDPEPSSDVSLDVVTETDDEWIEVSQAYFLSWSTAMQLHYCWRRDMHSALEALDDVEAEFFLRRAASYKAELDAQKEQDADT